MQKADEFLGEKAAARVLQVHPGTLRRYRTQGHIAYYRTATGRIHYRFDDLMKFALPIRVDPVAGALASIPASGAPPVTRA